MRLAKVMVSTGEVVSIIDGDKNIAARHNKRIKSEYERGHETRGKAFYANPDDYKPELTVGKYVRLDFC